MWDATPFLLLWWQNVLALWHFMIMETATQSPTVPAPAGEIVRPDPAALAAAELRRLRNEVATLRDLVASLTEGGHR